MLAAYDIRLRGQESCLNLITKIEELFLPRGTYQAGRECPASRDSGGVNGSRGAQRGRERERKRAPSSIVVSKEVRGAG